MCTLSDEYDLNFVLELGMNVLDLGMNGISIYLFFTSSICRTVSSYIFA